MHVTFDPVKNDRNIAERALSFERVAELDWETAQIREDTRRDYRERRFSVAAFLLDRLHVAIITRREDATDVISFRKANDREIRGYQRAAGGSGLTPG